ncbi:MAG TPA: hypothetical protein VM050_00675 [Patescibacteria group bacterium]|nr:hypothetical protein [Patescibacteria group bacterium]
MKEMVLTKKSMRTYENFGIEVMCRRCGKKFNAGDKVIKTRIRAGKKENPFYCVGHFYSECRKDSTANIPHDDQ